jgi:hypothetical protein
VIGGASNRGRRRARGMTAREREWAGNQAPVRAAGYWVAVVVQVKAISVVGSKSWLI